MFNQHGSFTQTWDTSGLGDSYTYTETANGLEVETEPNKSLEHTKSIWPNGFIKTTGTSDYTSTYTPDGNTLSTVYEFTPENNYVGDVYELTWIDGV